MRTTKILIHISKSQKIVKLPNPLKNQLISKWHHRKYTQSDHKDKLTKGYLPHKWVSISLIKSDKFVKE